ncbi:thioredoxin family protein [Desulfonatronum lacustre]|uniref:thioredoxin family protein n=1 Tax=Desulfonatronum lacustre TaxID=66849 RepID=UPI0004AF0616|nr:thioredoxin family protein [Desulfonatronum lacustre]SMP77135.1 thioredoxin 1 [Desulfonatronum zhilinae]
MTSRWTKPPTWGGKRLVVLTLGLVLVATVYFGTDVSRGNRGGPPTGSAGRVALLQLTAEHCPACRDMEPTLEMIRQSHGERVLIRQVDVFQRAGAASRYGVSTIPAHLFFDHQGRERYRHEGVMDRESVLRVLDELLAELDG